MDQYITATVTENEESDSVEIRFTDKPTTEILDLLRDADFQWYKLNMRWCAKRTYTTLEVAYSLVFSKQQSEYVYGTKLALEYLQNLPTIESGQYDNLKIQHEDVKVSLSRMTVKDGYPYNNQVRVETLGKNGWILVRTYEAK